MIVQVSLKSSDQDLFKPNDPYQYGVEVKIDHLKFPPHYSALNGAQGSASVVTQQLKQQVVVPLSLVQFDDKNQSVVYRLMGQKVVKTKVVLGLADVNQIVVQKGLKVGDQLVAVSYLE